MPQPPVIYPLNYTPGQFIQGNLPGFVSATTLTAKYSNFVAAGNLLVAVVALGVANQNITSVTDSIGNTWLSVPAIQAQSMTIQMFYVPNCLKGAFNAVTVNISGAAASLELAVLEYFGGGMYVGTNSASGSSTGPVQVTVGTIYAPPINPAGFTNNILTVTAGRVAVANINGVSGSLTQRLNDQNFLAVGDNPLATPAATAALVPGYTLSATAGWICDASCFYVPNLIGRPI